MKLMSVGDFETVIVGDGCKAVAGVFGKAVAGDGGTAIAGNLGRAIARDGGTAIAGDNGSASAGIGGKAAAGKGGRIAIWWRDGERLRVESSYVGENGIEPNVVYRLDDEGNFVKAP